MGQTINVKQTTVGDVLFIDADRSITGQDGTVYAGRDEAESDTSFPGRLALSIFDAADGVGHVFVASNQVVIRRSSDWTDDAVGSVSEAVKTFFVFYDDA